MAEEFDVITLGAGTAGEAIAGELKGSGHSLAVVESDHVGGECPYWGCMPSKTMLRSAEVLAEAGRAPELAVSEISWDVDFPKVAARTKWMARDFDDSKSAAGLEATGARLIRGRGRLLDESTVEVDGSRLKARHGIVIATGTRPSVPQIPGLDAVDFWTNREAVQASELPRSLVVIGGGPTGVEFAQSFARYGTQVHLVEAARLLPNEEPEVHGLLSKYLSEDGISIECCGVTAVDKTDRGVGVRLETGGELVAERILVATGRTPNLDGFELDAIDTTATKHGLMTDPQTLRVSDRVWAAGDIAGLGAFTHLAYYHGQIVGRLLKGERVQADHSAVPRVTYTDPEVASVGLSEQQAREKFDHVRVATQDVGETSRGYIHGKPGGIIKLVADSEGGVLVGATLVSPRAGEMISELSLAIKARIPVRTLTDFIHPFPSFSRGLQGMFAQLI